MNLKHAARSEDTEQINVIQWAQWNTSRFPELRWLHHCPNGGSRNAAEGAKLKQMGVLAGVPDLCLPIPKGIYHGLYIEMKYGNNRQQESQKEFLAAMAEQGHYVATCYSAFEAVEVLEEYMKLYVGLDREAATKYICRTAEQPELFERSKMSKPNNSIFKDGKVKSPKPEDT